VGVLPATAVVVEPTALTLAALWDTVLLLAFWLDHRAARRGGELVVERLRERRLSLGERNRITLRVTSFADRPLTLRLMAAPPAGVRREGDEGALLTVPAFGRRETSYELVPDRRGDHEFGCTRLLVLGPLGLAWQERQGASPETARVYPSLLSVKRLQLAAHRRNQHSLGFRKVRRDGEGDEFEKLSDYSSDDEFRRIDWKATARHGRPITRVYEAERSQNVVIAIDCGRMMAARCGPLTKLDAAINAALLVAQAALSADDRVGLLLFADRVLTYLPPTKGRRQFRAILEALYSVEASLTWVDYREAARTLRHRLRKRTLICLFTDLLDPEQSDDLLDAARVLRRRHLPLCITTADPGIEAMTRTTPADTGDVYRRVAATEADDERRALKRTLAAAGARVLDAAPGELSVAAVNAYVGIKRAGAL